MPPVTEMVLVVGPIEPATKRGFFRRAGLVGQPAGHFSGLTIYPAGLLGKVVFGQHHRHSAEGVGFDNVGSGVQVALVNTGDNVGAGYDEVFVAAFVFRPPEILRAQTLALNRRSHRSVDYQDPTAGLEQRFQGVDALSYVHCHSNWPLDS